MEPDQLIQDGPLKTYLAPLLLAFFLVAAALQGYRLGVGDLSTYIPFILHEHDATLFANDLLIQTLNSHPVYIWKFLSHFLDWISLEALFKGLFLLQVAIVTLSLFLFYRQFFGRNMGWIILLSMLVVGKKSPAMGLYGLNAYHYFHPGALAFGVTLFIYVLLDRGYWILGGILTGSIFLFHPFTAIYASLFFFVKLIVEYKGARRGRLLAGSVLLVLAASPSLLLQLTHLMQARSSPFDVSLWLELVRMRMGRSYFLSMWVPERYFYTLLVFIVFFRFRRHPAFRKVLPVIIAAMIALTTFGLAGVFGVKFFLQLQLARCTYFVYVLALAFIADHIASLRGMPKARKGMIWLFAGYFMMIYPVVEHGPGLIRWGLVIIAVGSLFVIFLRRVRGWRYLYVGIGLVLIVMITGNQVLSTHRLTGRIYDLTGTGPWDDMQVWCRENVPEDEIIMTPFYREGFRCLSRHSIYGSFKDGAPHNYSEGTIFRWWARMRRFGVLLQSPPDLKSFGRLYGANAVKIAKDEGIRMLVYDRRFVRLSGAPLYENERFGVIDLERMPDPEFKVAANF